MKRMHIFTFILFYLSSYCSGMDSNPSIESLDQFIDCQIHQQYMLRFLVSVIEPSQEKLMNVANSISLQYPSLCLDDIQVAALYQRNSYFAGLIHLYLSRMRDNFNKKLTIKNVDEVYTRKIPISGFDHVPAYIHTYCINKILEEIYTPTYIYLPLKSTPSAAHTIKDQKQEPWFFVHTCNGKLSLWKFNELMWELPEESKNECFVKCTENVKYVISAFTQDTKIDIGIWDVKNRNKIHSVGVTVDKNIRVADINYVEVKGSHLITLFTYYSQPPQAIENKCYPFVQVSQSYPVLETVFLTTQGETSHTSSLNPFLFKVSLDEPIKRSSMEQLFFVEKSLELFLLNKAIQKTPLVEMNLKVNEKFLNELSVYSKLEDSAKRFIVGQINKWRDDSFQLTYK